MKFTKNTLVVVALLLTLAACNKEQAEQQADVEPIEVSDVLATVNGENITQADVDFMIERTFSNTDQLFFDETMQAKVLDSLIAAKAMQQAVRVSLSESELKVIQNKARAYEEELYIKEYLVQNATPVPVSSSMVKDYYDANQDEFGGGESRVFEMLATSRKPTEKLRDQILNEISAIRSNQNWAAYIKNSELGLTRKSATMRPGLFDPILENAVKKLQKGETSDVVFIKGVPHVLRVLDVTTLPAKPLSSVSATIRKKLAAIQLKKAVKKASEDVVKQAKIELK